MSFSLSLPFIITMIMIIKNSQKILFSCKEIMQINKEFGVFSSAVHVMLFSMTVKVSSPTFLFYFPIACQMCSLHFFYLKYIEFVGIYDDLYRNGLD